MNKLIGLHFSPWTERARWALDYHAVPYRYSEYTSMLDEPWLRLQTGKLVGKVSVPLLLASGQKLNDSFLIAEFADTRSTRPALVPPAHIEAIREWVDAAEVALYSARIRATRRIQKSPAALAERLPAFVPGALRKALIPMSYLGAEFILRKYRLAGQDDAALLRNIDGFLAKAAGALKDREYIFADFSFADIVVATMLQAVRPVDPKYIDLGRASAAIMREPELEDSYADLLAWRDTMYARHRG